MKSFFFKNRKKLSSDINSMRQELRDLRYSVASLNNIVLQTLDLTGQTLNLSRPFGVPMPDGSMLVQTVHGIKYLIDPNDKVMAPQLIVYRDWEEDVSRIFLNNLDRSSVVVDVGANFGYFSCLAGTRIGDAGTGQVFAFEPNPRLVLLLRENSQINWSMAPVHIHPMAVGAASGSAVLSIPHDRAANASLSHGSDEFDKVDVEVVALDDALPHNLVVDLLKIDVEGHELGVLKGAREVIRRSPKLHIIMEWCLWQMIAAGCTAEEMIALFADLGLTARSLPETGLLTDAKPISLKVLRTTPYANIVLTKAGC